MFCRQQVAQLRGVVNRIRERGADLAVVGNGSVEQARAFAAAEGLDFPLYTDPDRTSFREAELRRGLASSLDLRVLGRGIAALREGYRQSATAGDPFQQGGALVIDRDGRVLYHFVSEVAGDHPAPESLLLALP